jgi:phage tail tube protein FII
MDNMVRGGNWFFDTLNTYRVLESVTLPEIKFTGEAFTPAGHMMGVDFQEEMEVLMATIKLKSSDDKIRGLVGKSQPDYTTCTYYENLESYREGGQRKGRVITIKGLIRSAKQDEVKGLKPAGTEFEVNTIVLYHDMVDGRTIHKFDFFGGAGETVINGERPYAQMAANLMIGAGLVL